jgi:hypothetical protein
VLVAGGGATPLGGLSQTALQVIDQGAHALRIGEVSVGARMDLGRPVGHVASVGQVRKGHSPGWRMHGKPHAGRGFQLT